MKMYLTDDEIRDSFNSAADKNAQVKILADLNACKPNDILVKLEQLGLITPTILSPARSGKISGGAS